MFIRSVRSLRPSSVRSLLSAPSVASSSLRPSFLPASSARFSHSSAPSDLSPPQDQLTPEQIQNQRDHAAWGCAKTDLYMIALAIGGYFVGKSWYDAEVEHLHHDDLEYTHYPFILRNEGSVAAGWWPGKNCQLFQWNCAAETYEKAERLLRQKRGEDDHHEGGDHGHGHGHH